MQLLIFISHLFIYNISFFLGNKYYCFLIFLRNYLYARIIIIELFYEKNSKFKNKINLQLEYAKQKNTKYLKAIRLLKSELKNKKSNKKRIIL